MNITHTTMVMIIHVRGDRVHGEATTQQRQRGFDEPLRQCVGHGLLSLRCIGFPVVGPNPTLLL